MDRQKRSRYYTLLPHGLSGWHKDRTGIRFGIYESNQISATHTSYKTDFSHLLLSRLNKSNSRGLFCSTWYPSKDTFLSWRLPRSWQIAVCLLVQDALITQSPLFIVLTEPMLPIDMFYRPLRRVTGYIGGGQAPASFEKSLTEYLAETEYSVVVADLKRHFL